MSVEVLALSTIMYVWSLWDFLAKTSESLFGMNCPLTVSLVGNSKT